MTGRRPRRSSLAAREARLAYLMLAPGLLIVLLVVIFPVLANFWISFKEIRLGNLRPPAPTVRESVRETPEAPGDTLLVRYQLRNSSRDVTIEGVALTARIPQGLEPAALPDGCAADGGALRCELGDFAGGHRENLEVAFTAGPDWFEAEAGSRAPTAARVTGTAPNLLTNLDFSLANYRQVLSGSRLWPSLWTTIVYTVGGSVGSILLGLFAAQLLNARFPGQGFLRGLFLFPYIAPVIAVAFAWAFFLDPFSGSLNLLAVEAGILERPVSFLSQRSFEVDLFGFSVRLPLALSTVIAFEAWRYFPFAFLFILARLQAIPTDMYEAAQVDGASPLQRFRWITLPQLVGVLSTLFLLRFIWTFNKFDDIFLLTGGAAGTRTLTIEVYDNAFARSDIGAGAAMAVVLFVILAVFMVLYFRFVPEEA